MDETAPIPSNAQIRFTEPAAEGAPLDGIAPSPPAVPDHELFQRIGAGSYGEVWLARNLATGALRAVKIVYRSTFADERPFNREFLGIKKFDAVSRSHPSQLALFHVGRNAAAGYFYYVMELADSIPPLSTPSASLPTSYTAHTLRAGLEQGRLPAARVLEIALSLTEALAHLHANGLIHRDVKPSNIIFVGGRPKLADIGLVTDASDSHSIVGTEGYLPREGPGTPAADIFALGKVLYEALTGLDRRQFPHLPTELREWSDGNLVFELNEILLKACAADARERYASADSMLADLKLLDAGKSVKRRRTLEHVWSISWKIAIVFALSTAAFFLIQNYRAERAAAARLSASALEKSGTTNRMAMQALNRAFHMAGNYSAPGFSNALQEFERSVALDPNFSEGWCMVSVLLGSQVDYGYLPASNALARARICAEKAIGLKPVNGFAHGALADATLPLDYDFGAAEALYRKGIELEPANMALKVNFARLLIFHNRLPEAEAFLNQFMQENPSVSIAFRNQALLLAASGRFQEAVSSLDEADLLALNQPFNLSLRADILFAMDEKAAAANDLLRFVELDGFAALNGLVDGAVLRRVLEESGPTEFLRFHIQILEDRLESGHFVSWYDLARLNAHSDNMAMSLDYLERTIDEHRLLALGMKVNPLFQDYHNEPRFRAVLRRLKLQK